MGRRSAGFIVPNCRALRPRILAPPTAWADKFNKQADLTSISGLVVEYIVAIDVTRVRFPADAFHHVFAHARARAMHLYGTSPSGAQETVVHKRTSHS